jgi:hypothetical protein
LKNSREVRRLQKTSYTEDWSCQVGVEIQDTMGAHVKNILMMFPLKS